MTPLERAAKRPIEMLIPYLGYGEKDSASGLDRMDTYGHKNYTFIAQYFDDLKAKGYSFYNTRKQGGEWCDMTVDWAMCQAFGPENARAVLYQPMESCGAGCVFSANYYRQNGAWISRGGEPRTGDQIFFGPKGDETHTGLVERVDASNVYTIEGNTSDRLLRKSYGRNESKIAGYGRPNYQAVAYLFIDGDTPIQDDEEEIDMDDVRKLVEQIVDERIDEALGPMIHNYAEIPWASVRGEVEEMVKLGVIDGGTSAEVNPDDVNMRLQLLRVLVVAKRFALKVVDELPGEEAREVLIAELERMLAELKAE